MNKLKALLIAGLLSLTSVSFASTVSFNDDPNTWTGTTGAEGSISLVNNDGGVTVGGFLRDTGGDFWDLSTDSGSLAAIALELDVTPTASTGNVVIALYDTLANMAIGLTAALDYGTNSLYTSLSGGTNYLLAFTGEIGTSYNADVSAVPVPAAGILFASALLGAGALGRRKKKSAKTSMVGAFTRAS